MRLRRFRTVMTYVLSTSIILFVLYELYRRIKHSGVELLHGTEFRHLSPDNYLVKTLPNNNLCNSNFLLLILIISGADHQLERKLLRETYLTQVFKSPYTKYAFLIGSTQDDELNRKVEEEIQQHGDLIQGAFQDTYDNLSVKSLFLLKWTADHCSNASFVMKIDDDVYFNLHKIIEMLQSLETHKLTIAGRIWSWSFPIRGNDKKWHSDDFFTEWFYPTYASGAGYIISQDLLLPLFNAAMTMPCHRIEDVFVTGMCRSKLTNTPIRLVNNAEMSLVRDDVNAQEVYTAVTAHGLTSQALRAAWKLLTSSQRI